MQKSESIKNIATALSKFQGEMGAITKDASNPFYRSKFASLANIIEATRDPLARNGLSYAQFPIEENELATILMHTSGEWISGGYKMTPIDSKPQSRGSSISYQRRYALCGILGLQVEDDDGNAASQSPKVQKVMHNQHQDHQGNDVVVYGGDYIEDVGDEPISNEVAKPKKAPSANVLKKSIADSLKSLGMPCANPQEVADSVKKATDIDLEVENYKMIADTLRGLVEFEAAK